MSQGIVLLDEQLTCQYVNGAAAISRSNSPEAVTATGVENRRDETVFGDRRPPRLLCERSGRTRIPHTDKVEAAFGDFRTRLFGIACRRLIGYTSRRGTGTFDQISHPLNPAARRDFYNQRGREKHDI